MFAGVQPTDRSDEEYRTAFKMFDRDGDGTITRGEIQKVLSTLGQEATQEELDMLMGDVSRTSSFIYRCLSELDGILVGAIEVWPEGNDN